MSDDVKPRIRVPASAKKGEIIEIKTLVTHPMESGQRKDSAGNTVARRIINRLTVIYNGKTVFDARLEPAIAANPYLAFYVRAEESGSLTFTWLDDDGSKYTAEQKLTVA